MLPFFSTLMYNRLKCSVYIAASLDGFIAKKDGDISWLERPDYSPDKIPGLRYDEFIRTVDGIVMGRNSFDKVLTFGSWPYNDTPVIVLSSGELNIPGPLHGKVSAENGPPGKIISRLKKRGFRHLYIDGGITIQKFLHAGLIDDIIITTIPVLLGDGIPLFGTMKREINVRLARVDRSENGLIQTKYSVIK
jgi:dihydrofolate reductase